MRGYLIAFEGLDQSGKQTQAEGLRDHLAAQGFECRLLAFPDYATAIGAELSRALHAGPRTNMEEHGPQMNTEEHGSGPRMNTEEHGREHEYGADVMQLLYVANRYEKRTTIEEWLAQGIVVLCDRYVASGIAYGEAQGLDPQWLADIQRFLPPPHLTVLLDIAPETASRRKAVGRDRYERDLALLSRVRASYARQAAAAGWLHLDGERPKADVMADVIREVSTRLARR